MQRIQFKTLTEYSQVYDENQRDFHTEFLFIRNKIKIYKYILIQEDYIWPINTRSLLIVLFRYRYPIDTELLNFW